MTSQANKFIGLTLAKIRQKIQDERVMEIIKDGPITIPEIATKSGYSQATVQSSMDRIIKKARNN